MMEKVWPRRDQAMTAGYIKSEGGVDAADSGGGVG